MQAYVLQNLRVGGGGGAADGCWPDLRQDGRAASALRVGMLAQVLQDLVSHDAACECRGHALSGQRPHEQIRQQALAADKQAQDGMLQL